MPAGSRVRANNVFGTVVDNPLAAGATTLTSVELALLPEVTASEHAVLTLDPLRQHGEPEIVVVTAHAPGAQTATITRGAYNTIARDHPQTTVWVHAPVTEDVESIVTSTTRPTDPYAGQRIFEIDTDTALQRNAANSAWVTPPFDISAHDVTARHQFGAALGTPGAPLSTLRGVAASAGSGAGPARSDHRHATAGLPGTAAVLTSQSRTASSFGDLATVGPTVTLTTGTRVLVGISCNLIPNAQGDAPAMAIAVSGATTLAAPAGGNQNVTFFQTNISGFIGAQSQSTHVFVLTVNAGSNTFTAKYASLVGGTAIFSNRQVWVLPIN